jgi:hypothetical protein
MDMIEIKTPKGRLQYAIVENGKLYLRKFKRGSRRGVGIKSEYEKGKPFVCSCKFDKEKNNKDELTLFVYEDGKMYCPSCNKTIEIVRTVEDMKREAEEEEKARIQREKEAQENVHLCFVDQSVSSGLQYYELSTRVEYDTWKEIKDLFFYMSYDEDDEEQDTFGMTKLTGWLTTQPGKVEERLNVKPELRLAYRRKEAEKRKKARDELNKEKSELKEKIFNAFKPENATQPWADETKKGTQGSSMIKYPAGEELEDPKYPFDIYGGGRSWIIDQNGNKIWMLNNNGHDGDNWGLNNVATGGAGAIGVYVPYTDKLEKLIRDYVTLFDKKMPWEE